MLGTLVESHTPRTVQAFRHSIGFGYGILGGAIRLATSTPPLVESDYYYIAVSPTRYHRPSLPFILLYPQHR